MSYGEPGAELRFDFHTACLSGNNGEGKSALLDAMTWALWGKARNDRLAADDVVRLGADEATVSFDFGVGEALYRVVRRRHRKRGAALDLLVSDTGEFRPLTSHTQRDTQAVINDLLRMDYETFLNSAFLAQGRADEFTRQTPAERKRLLGEILGLSQYERLETLARQNSREAAMRSEHEKRECERIEREVEEEPKYREEFERLTRSLAESEEAARQAESVLGEARKHFAALEQASSRLKEAEARVARLQQDEQRLAQQIESFKARIEAHNGVIARRQEILAGFASYQEARARLAEFDRKQTSAAEIEKRRSETAHKIDLERQQLLAQAQALEQRLSELSALAARLPEIHAEAEKVRSQAQSLEQTCEQAERTSQEVADLKTRLALLNQQSERLNSEQPALSQKMEMLGQAEARCPLCRQALSEEDKARLVQEMTAQQQDMQRQAAENEGSRRAVAGQLTELDKRLRQFQAALKPLPTLQRQLGELERRLHEAEQAKAQMAEFQSGVAQLKATLERGEFAHEQRAALQALERESAAVGYDPEEHRAARQKATELEKFAEQARALEQAEKDLPKDRSVLEQMQASHESSQQAMRDAEKDSKDLREQARQLPQARARMEASAKQAEAAQRERTRLAAEVAARRERLDRLKALRDELAQRRKDLRQAETDAVIWGDLAVAFSKDGIQALVIENVVPQLEQDANDLLDRLTDGRMHLAIRTEKPVKSRGTTAETLEIHISDELGERKYESYSGGEAFRINFAIRVALARLLAQRAGAKLQTLIVDEGFGTQDADARDRLIEAIRTIGPDFEKILVVTHIEEMKEAFPHRIVVTKDENGSRLQQITS